VHASSANGCDGIAAPMGDTVFGFGKYRGQTFQGVFDKDRGYVTWVQKLENTTGQMLAFQEYCKGRAGSASMSGMGIATPQQQAPAFAAPGPAAGAASQGGRALRPPPPQAEAYSQVFNPNEVVLSDFELCAELLTSSTFRLAAAKPGAFVPQPIWRALCGLSGGQMAENKKEWVFQLADYQSVLKQISQNHHLAGCQFEQIPKWTLSAITQAKENVGDLEEADCLLQEHIEALPPKLKEECPIMDFQKEGIKFGLSRGGRCLIGDEMGLGKSLQALAIIASYRSEWPVLVVVPSSLRLMWKDQALTWLPHHLTADQVTVLDKGKQKVPSDAQLVVIGYDLLGRNPEFRVGPNGKDYQVAIIDEAHYIKSAGAKRTEAVLDIAKKAKRCILLTGTPAVNRAEDLFTQVQALLPQHVPRNKTQFCTRYCEKKEMKGYGRSFVKWDGARNKMELYTLLTSTIMIRRLKKDVLTQLPAKRRQRIFLAASKMNAERMAELQEWLAEKRGAEEDGMESAPADVMHCFRITAEAKIDGVADYVEYLLSNDVKFLIFGHHHVMLDAIEKKVSSAGVKYIRIDGKTPAAQRQGFVQQFQTDTSTRVAVLGITACGQGLTLTAAHTVVFAELYWVPGQMLQAEDRVHRIGQQEMVDVHYCIAPGSLDEIMYNSLNRKSKDTSAITDGLARDMNISAHANAGSVSGAAASRPLNTASPKKRGRPPSTPAPGEALEAGDRASPKKRGRPSKGESVSSGLARYFGRKPST